MSFLDDIGDAISDVTSAVGDGVSTLASEAYSTVLSPTESFAMKGLGAAGSAVSNLFGDLEITDIGELVSDVGEIAAFPAMGMPVAVVREALGSVIAKSSIPGVLKNNSIAQILENNSITQIIDSNPLASLVANNIKESNQGLFDVADMLLQEDSQKASNETNKRSQESSGKINLEKMGLGLLGNKGRIARPVNRPF
ncbi:MAG: hypothetical protein K2X77_33985 [Candidatus Obscuribacterales bacterium]|nr:hypothetical protein [Candidatus Obscuribacterales bacterium]